MDVRGKLELASAFRDENLICAATRFYTQITGDKARQLSEKRTVRQNSSAVGATRIDDHDITADEVLEHLNKIMSPWQTCQ